MAGYERAFLRGDPLLRRVLRFARRIARGVARRVAARLGPRVTQRLLGMLPPRGGGPMTVPEELLARPARAAAMRPKVVHAIGSLGPGGAERQLAALVCGLQPRGGETHEVLTIAALEGASAHYRGRIEAAAVPVSMAGSAPDPAVLALLRHDPATREALAAMPAVLRPLSVDLAGEFLARRPDIVHAWLDQTNICAGIAALATGVPRIVLSLRSVNPSHFPMLHVSWMRDGYRALARSPRVRIVANSRAGAEDYAQWMGIDPARIAVVHNGLDPAQIREPDPGAVERTRRELAPNGERVLLGVLRLSEEKRPELFVEVARRVLAADARARAVLVGDGPLAAEIAALARPLGVRLAMLGRRDDVPELMAAARVTLLCSRMEGTPNALIESQWLGTPVVSTAVGGAVDAVDDGASGFLCARDDAAALAARCGEILGDDALHARLSTRAREFARERFALARMLDDTQALYR
jgi:glycosyltransferase involved in cell wall biosynthesis